jgi:hypothetical protein
MAGFDALSPAGSLDPAKAPKWNDKDQLVATDGKVIFDDRAPKTKREQ